MQHAAAFSFRTFQPRLAGVGSVARFRSEWHFRFGRKELRRRRGGSFLWVVSFLDKAGGVTAEAGWRGL
jgi:hypothetical protein